MKTNARQTVGNSQSHAFAQGLLALPDHLVSQVLDGLTDQDALIAWAEVETRPGVKAAIMRKLGTKALEGVPTLVVFARVAEIVAEKGLGPTMHELSRVVDARGRLPGKGEPFTEAEIVSAQSRYGHRKACATCNRVGDLVTEIGLRRMNGPGSVVRPQPHCTHCRNARPAASARKVLGCVQVKRRRKAAGA